MKLKGISWIEQHLEKVFACVFFAALLVVLALQFVGKGSEISVDKKDVPLNAAWETVAARARMVGQRVASTALPEGETDKATEQIVEFSKRFKGPVSPSPTLSIAIGETSNIGTPSSVRIQGGIAQYTELKIPAPTSPIAAANLTLVSPAEVKEYPEIAAVLPPAMPYDKAGVTVEAEFSGQAVHEMLAMDPDGDGPIRAMPRHWLDALQILDVELVREELAADGTWKASTTIVPIPGRFSLRPELAKPIPGAAYLKELAKIATESAEAVRRPRYYRSWIGEKWMTPSETREKEMLLQEAAKEGDDVRRLREQADRRLKTLEGIEDQLARLGPGGAPPGGDRPPRPSPSPGGGGGGAGKAPPGGGGGGGQRPDAPRVDPTDRQRKQLEGQRNRVQRELESFVTRLAALGEDVSKYGAGGPDGATPVDATAAPTEVEAPFLENPSIKVWAHDVSVVRGATYRYQVRVVLNNPMFGQSNVMVPEQQEWAKPAMVRSEPSAWTEPVKVDEDSYYFIVSANSGDRVMNRVAGARAELFTFKWGRWRKGDVPLEPGDRVEAMVKYPDMSSLLVALGGPAWQPGPLLIAGQPERRDQRQPPAPSPPPNSSPNDNRRLPPPGQIPGDERGPRRAEPPAQGADPVAPEKPLPILTAEVKVDAIFLNVGDAPTVAGATRAGSIVYLRAADGTIATRSPDTDNASGLLARLRRSALEGEKDLKPAEPEKVDERPRPVRPDEEQPAPGGKAPGGGGGA